MSADDINQTITDAQETVRELNDPDMEKVDEQSLAREEVGLKEAGIPMEAGECDRVGRTAGLLARDSRHLAAERAYR
ncbi:hypothetical protein [Parascardovia denticolens]